MKCKYNKICNLYRKNSHTCNHGGGSYCGRFREYEGNTFPSDVHSGRLALPKENGSLGLLPFYKSTKDIPKTKEVKT